MIANESKEELCQNSVINIHRTSLIRKQKKKGEKQSERLPIVFRNIMEKERCSINNRHN